MAIFALSKIMVTVFLVGCGCCHSEEAKESFPRVNTKLGMIEGYYQISSNGRRYETYEGIPYAQPPTGELRFGVTRRALPWMDMLIAKQFRSPCMQYRSILNDSSDKVVGSEDCLYLNIYIPAADDRNHLTPVIFYIHGGAFQMGSPNKQKAKYILDNNVTLVTITYRVGPLGFLSTEDEIVPGNMGLKDQAIALHWVKDNIQSFGGDPSRITIFGQSAGGASVHYHYLTNLTAGLFQRGISLSGTALNCWAQAERSLEKAKKLATSVGCQTDSIQRMVDCLKIKPARDIIEATQNIVSWMSLPNVPFGPVVEKGGGEFTFIDQPPIKIINSSKVQDIPWITGIVSEEGLCQMATFACKEKILQELNDNWEDIAPHLLDFNYTVPKTEHSKVARLIKRHYLGIKKIDSSTFNKTVRMVGDRLFGYDAEEAARLQAKVNQSPVRFYYFSYRGAHSFSELLSGSNEDFGVSHSDDESYIFQSHFNPTTTPRDRKMQKELLKLWISFAIEGIPNTDIEWPAVNQSTSELNYLNIAGPDEITAKTSLHFGESDFWNSLGIQENEN